MSRALQALDWGSVAAALEGAARTPMGVDRVRRMTPMSSVPAIADAYALVTELLAASGRIPVSAVSDVREELGRAARGMVLEAASLISVGGAILGLVELHDWVEKASGERIRAHAPTLDVNEAVGIRIREAFDRAGVLADAAWPTLATLRRQYETTRVRVQTTFDGMLSDEGWGEKLMERYVTERDGRLVLPVKMSFRKGIGILHGTSASGETAYVEPGETVELQNDLRELRDAIEAETQRILAELSAMVARVAVVTLAALEATGELDVAQARAELGRLWDGSVPKVGAEGVIELRGARHPVLALRAKESGSSVVPNDLTLNGRQRALVLTGPNAGGKTVALKTIGLCAVLVRMGIPIPAGEGSRVDCFDPIIADIGDLQSIHGDLSTFSGHLAALRDALAVAAPGTLVLVDEVAVGTDPAQGAALAAAIVEELIERDARVVVTTHYPELKSTQDSRIVVGGMDFADGRPTYRLSMGRPSGSQALVIAQRMGLPRSVLERARTLLDEGSAKLARLAETLEDEREAVRIRSRQLDTRDAGLDGRDGELAEREEKVRRAMEGDRQRVVEATRERLAAMEVELRDLVAGLHRGGTLGTVNEGLRTLRSARAGLDAPDATAPTVTYQPAKGERVWVTTVAQHGTVVGLQGEMADVQVKSMRLRLPLTKLTRAKDGNAPQTGEAVSGVGYPPTRCAVPLGTGKAASPPHPADRQATPGPRPFAQQTGGVVSGVRLPSNTLDMRGMRLDEATSAVESFISTLLGNGERYGFLLHGHGTGALKAGLRERLRGMSGVASFRRGELGEGGDAYTVIEVGRGG